ncbi:MAG: NADH-quinone oxidoreductase subunit NuoF [Candidatus Izemoplasmataceae bacterium]
MLEKRLVSERIGKIRPESIEDYIESGGYKTLEKAFDKTRIEILEEIEASRLRGRGGAGFPVAVKMMGMAKESRTPKYVVCNADEGEPGNFKDRYLMENDPHHILEGMIIAAYATMASQGYIYIRGEYNQSIKTLRQAVKAAREKGYLGKDILGSGFDFDIEIRSGAGSYVCGEEFSLLESIEGKPGHTRVKPPFPTEKGLFGHPTLINNVETFSTLPLIMEMGGKKYAGIGTESSTGTKLISLSGNVKNKGVFEVPYGLPLRTIIKELGGGVPAGRKLKMVQLGGACGPIIPEYMLDMIMDFERFEEFDSKVGAGAIIVIDDRYDIFEILKRTSEFFSHESCGKCTPCREGNTHLKNLVNKFQRYEATERDLHLIENLARVMHQTSLCGLGQTAPTAVISTLHYFRSEYLDRIEKSYAKEAHDGQYQDQQPDA